MSKLKSLKVQLQKMLEQFSQLSTDKGIITWSGDEEMPIVGDEIRLLDEDGNEVNAEDGEYKNDVVSIKVESGKVVEIVDIVVEEPKEDEPVEEPVDEPIDEPVEEQPIEEPQEPVIEEPVEEPIEEPVVEEPVEDERDAKIAELEAEIARLKEEIERLQKLSAAKPAEEVFKTVNKIEKTGDKKIDRLIDVLNA